MFTSAWKGSATDEWPTPQKFYEQLVLKHGPFDLDPCATQESAKCERFFTLEDDGLAHPWAPARVFMNPPYSNVAAWMQKALDESRRGAFVCALVPARVDTAWWHDYAEKARYEFVRGRLKFGAATASAPFASAVVLFGHGALDVAKGYIGE